MNFLISGKNSEQPQITQVSTAEQTCSTEDIVISSAADLLELYLDTEESAPLMLALRQIRNAFLDDLDQVETVKEIYGLIYWLLADAGVDHRGESLEDTADRLGDIDIENDSERYTDLIFHLKDAVERIYDIELE